MGLYARFLYPHVTKLVGKIILTHPANQRAVDTQFSRISGDVLEIGLGPGDSLPVYDPERVSRVYGLDPNAQMIAMAKENARSARVPVELLERGAEAIPLDDASIDTAFSNWTFCTIPDLPAALGEIRRVLKPGRRLVFWEHGISPDPHIRRWQQREEPLHLRMFQGCHITRDIPRAMDEGGFVIRSLEEGYIPRCPKSWGWSWRGVAEAKPD